MGEVLTRAASMTTMTISTVARATSTIGWAGHERDVAVDSTTVVSSGVFGDRLAVGLHYF